MSPQKKMPTSLKTVIGINIFRIFVSFLVLGLIGYAMSNNFESGTVWQGIKDALIDRLGLTEDENISSTIAYLFGGMLIPLVLMFSQIILIKRGKNHTWTWILTLFDAFSTFGNGSLPLMPGICFVLLMSKSAKDYFNGNIVETDVNILDDI